MIAAYLLPLEDILGVNRPTINGRSAGEKVVFRTLFLIEVGLALLNKCGAFISSTDSGIDSELVQAELFDEGVAILLVFGAVDVSTGEVPTTANEVSNHENNSNKPEYPIGKHDQILRLSSICAL